MFKKITIGFGTILILVSVGMATNVQAKLNEVLGVGVVAEKAAVPQLSVVDCRAGEQILAGAGFKHVFATECSGAQYSFNGFRGGNEYSIVFNAQSSGFTAVSR